MRRRILAGAAAAAIGTVAILRPFGPQGCAIVGDSLAVGLAQLELGCAANARVGRRADVIARQPLQGRFSWGVISAGSNNPLDPNLRAQLREIRARMNADRVIWIVPAHPRAAALVRAVAAERADLVQTIIPGPDGIHPRSYPELRRAVRGRLS